MLTCLQNTNAYYENGKMSSACVISHTKILFLDFTLLCTTISKKIQSFDGRCDLLVWEILVILYIILDRLYLLLHLPFTSLYEFSLCYKKKIVLTLALCDVTQDFLFLGKIIHGQIHSCISVVSLGVCVSLLIHKCVVNGECLYVCSTYIEELCV